jgi:WD40 repeat protein
VGLRSGPQPWVLSLATPPTFATQAVSGDHAGTVSVWHVGSGKLRFRFYNAHKEHAITAMDFDAARRRLITGSDSGEVKVGRGRGVEVQGKGAGFGERDGRQEEQHCSLLPPLPCSSLSRLQVWNFSSGACLSTLKTRGAEEVTSVVAVRGALMRHFLVAGWDRRVTYFDDNGSQQVRAGRALGLLQPPVALDHPSESLPSAALPPGGPRPLPQGAQVGRVGESRASECCN